DGTGNVINNAGALSALSGVAVHTGLTASTSPVNPIVTTVNNSGVITGSYVNDPGTTININNQVTGVLATGAQIFTSPGGTLMNAGALEVGGPNHIATTHMVGTLAQTSSGRMVVDLAPFTPGIGPQADQIELTGHAQLSGQVKVRLRDLGEGGH